MSKLSAMAVARLDLGILHDRCHGCAEVLVPTRADRARPFTRRYRVTVDVPAHGDVPPPDPRKRIAVCGGLCTLDFLAVGLPMGPGRCGIAAAAHVVFGLVRRVGE